MAILVIFTIGSFFFCVDAKRYLERLILPSVEGWLLKSFVQTAIIMSYVVPLAITALLIRSKLGPLQLLGMAFGGIAFGIVIRIAIIFAAVLFPFG
jgi:hypothetical protein